MQCTFLFMCIVLGCAASLHCLRFGGFPFFETASHIIHNPLF